MLLVLLACGTTTTKPSGEPGETGSAEDTGCRDLPADDDTGVVAPATPSATLRSDVGSSLAAIAATDGALLYGEPAWNVFDT